MSVLCSNGYDSTDDDDIVALSTCLQGEDVDMKTLEDCRLDPRVDLSVYDDALFFKL